ncbi:MAG: ferritin-like domain-containing protein [Microthrixaceae bacterium]|nr:ferritin-like domain-containing protein [Microthrixaceae bacterium]
MASEGYHEPLPLLNDAIMDRHRAIVSIMEELEAVDWYDQRVTATDDESLAAILAHNRDEEKEHAAMTIEWLRRHDERFDEELRTYLFNDGPITEVEQRAMGRNDDLDDGSAEAVGAPDVAPSSDVHSLRIGSLKHHQPEEPA